jgi:hypothetical protein
MHLIATIRNSLILAGAALFLAPPAQAQVTLNLTTVEQTNCVAVTDAQGLQLVPGGTDLQATGVTLTGTGCGSANSEFDVTLNAPSSAEAGTPISISWSATDAATKCTYGGTTGVADWPVGQTACDGGACAGPHSKSVNLPAAGNYSFSMTCTNATGFAQDGLTATGAPQAPQPPNFVLTAPATATVGTPIQVSWSVTGATACSGSASLNGSSTNLPGWTDSTSPTSPRSITFTQAGAYVLNLSCSNSNGSTPSQPRAITASVAGDPSCPAGRQTVADVCYSYGPSNCANNSDVTTFENIWGRTAGTDPTAVLFPGENVFAILKNMQKTGYIAAKFVAPTTPNNSWGIFNHAATTSGPPLDASISSTCGDFNLSDFRCDVTGIPTGDNMIAWKLPGYTGPSLCQLTPGATYYLNIKLTDPAAIHNDCSGATCKVNIQNNHTP